MPSTCCRTGGEGGGIVALDALGNVVKESSWLADHKAGDRSLVQGLKVCSVHPHPISSSPRGPILTMFDLLPPGFAQMHAAVLLFCIHEQHSHTA